MKDHSFWINSEEARFSKKERDQLLSLLDNDEAVVDQIERAADRYLSALGPAISAAETPAAVNKDAIKLEGAIDDITALFKDKGSAVSLFRSHLCEYLGAARTIAFSDLVTGVCGETLCVAAKRTVAELPTKRGSPHNQKKTERIALIDNIDAAVAAIQIEASGYQEGRFIGIVSCVYAALGIPNDPVTDFRSFSDRRKKAKSQAESQSR